MRRASTLMLFLPLFALLGCNEPSSSGKSPGKSAAATGTPATDSPEVSATPTAALPPATGAPGSISPDNSKIEWVGSKADGKHDGGFKAFSGKIEPLTDNLAGSKISLEIETDSLYSDNPMLTGHLKRPDFFDVKKFPKATFTSTAIQAGTVTGDLTLHGKTKSITFPAKIETTAKDVTITANFSIDRKDFGMTYGAGQVNDEVKIKVMVHTPRS